MKESALSAIRSEMQSPETVYGMPAHKDRTAAVNEVHARPHLLITSPQTLLQFAFMTKGDQSGDQRVMFELSDRLGLTPSENSAPCTVSRGGKALCIVKNTVSFPPTYGVLHVIRVTDS